MSITQEISRIAGNIQSAYSALESQGVTVPETRNSANLSGTIRELPGVVNSLMKLVPDVGESAVSQQANGQVFRMNDEVCLKTAAGAVPIAGIEEPYIAAAVNTLADKVRSRQKHNTVTFIAAGDFHNDIGGENSNSANIQKSNRHALQAIKLLCEKVKIDFVCGMGDYTWCCNQKTDRAMGQKEIESIVSGLVSAAGGRPLFLTTGNHDPLADARTNNGNGTYSSTVGNHYIGTSDMFPLVEIYNDYTAASNVGYGYRDFDKFKLRVVVLNTADSDFNISSNAASSNGWIGDIGPAQAQWLVGAIDLSDKDDADEWKTIILAHHPLDWGRLIPVVNILKAYEDGDTGSFSYVYGRSEQTATISYDFAGKNAAQIIAQIHGHVHGFRVDNLHYYDSNDDLQTVHIQKIAVPNACYVRTNEYGNNGVVDTNGIEMGVPADGTTYNKVANTANDTAFTVFTVDLDEDMIYADHYGAGYDRVIDSYVDPYDNLASECTDGYRLKTDDTLLSNSYMTLSDYIEADYGDTVLFDKAEWFDDSSRNIFCTIHIYDSNHTQVARTNTAPTKTNGFYRIPITSDTFSGLSSSDVAYFRINVVGTADRIKLYLEPVEPAETEPLPDYMQTNLVPLSIDENGDIYNSVGYMNQKRLNSSASIVNSPGDATTGFIPISAGDTLHFGGGEWITKAMSNDWCYGYLHVYDANKNSIGRIYTDNGEGSTTPTLDTDDYDLYTITIDNNVSWKSAPADYSQIAYCRFSLVGSGANFVAYIETSGS